MYRAWPFFRPFVDDVAMTLFETDPEIASDYVAHVVPAEPNRLFDELRAEYDRTVEHKGP